MAELGKIGIECDDPMKAQSVLQRDKMAKGEDKLQMNGNPMLNPETAAKSAEEEEVKLREHISSKKGIRMIEKEMKMSTRILKQKCVELQLKIWNEKKNCWQIQIEEKKYLTKQTTQPVYNADVV